MIKELLLLLSLVVAAAIVDAVFWYVVIDCGWILFGKRDAKSHEQGHGVY
jgi:hypothetical protein